MKPRYLIIISHLLLYVLSYFGLVLYCKYYSAIDSDNAFAVAFVDIVNVFIKIITILIVLTILPIAGTLIGVATKSKEIKIGFFAATIFAIIFDIWFCWYWYS